VSAPAVLARGLRKAYNGRVAVDGIDFEVEPGICFGFLGPNGAGKTTTMKMIYGLAEIEAGELRVLGLDARRQRREQEQARPEARRSLEKWRHGISDQRA